MAADFVEDANKTSAGVFIIGVDLKGDKIVVNPVAVVKIPGPEIGLPNRRSMDGDGKGAFPRDPPVAATSLTKFAQMLGVCGRKVGRPASTMGV